MTLLRTAAVALALFAVAAAPAAAKLPSPTSHLIKPPTSIGGVKVGMKPAAALAKWGGGSSDCSGETAAIESQTCHWAGTAKQGSASITFAGGAVSSVEVTVGQKANGNPNYHGPILKLFKTKKHIHIGSPIGAVQQKYPHATADGTDVFIASGKTRMTFGSSLGRVNAISLIRTAA